MTPFECATVTEASRSVVSDFTEGVMVPLNGPRTAIVAFPAKEIGPVTT